MSRSKRSRQHSRRRSARLVMRRFLGPADCVCVACRHAPHTDDAKAGYPFCPACGCDWIDGPVVLEPKLFTFKITLQREDIKVYSAAP